MPLHWTYKRLKIRDKLLQGDILEPTEKLCTVLEKEQPRFLDPKYNAFILITQSCDLVPRRGKYKTEYLNIAVVCPLKTVLNEFLSQICNPIVHGAYFKKSKEKANLLLERIFNQNEQSLGLFYLHPDEKAGIEVHSVALLRETFTLRINYYDILKKARRGRLNEEFRSRLGWLVGNLYSRVGTQDWSEKKERKEELEKLIDNFLKRDINPYAPIWIPETWVTAAKEKGVQLKKISLDDIFSVMESCKPPTAKELAINQALNVLQEFMPDISPDSLKLIRNRLLNDSLFATAIRKAKSE